MKKRIAFKVEKKRVLVPVGEPCIFGCRYCYARGGEVGPARVTAQEILQRFQEFVPDASFETIQLGYDSDPFAHPERGILMLEHLATMGKHVNFSTKASLQATTLDALCKIRDSMQAEQTALSALVSLSCWYSACHVEPFTATPHERIQTVANLTRAGIPTFIAVRPILPHIADEEYERIAIEGIQAGCEGFILGPLYDNDHGQFVRFIPSAVLEATPGKSVQVSWSAHSPRWTRYEDPERLQRLLKMIQAKGGRTFLSSSEAIEQLQQKVGTA
jgi:DNA repair photolyase